MAWKQPQLTIPPMGPTDEIKKLQHRLIFAYNTNSKAKELGVTESGIFDAATDKALRNMQLYLASIGAPKYNSQPGVLTYDCKLRLGVIVLAPVGPPPIQNAHLYSAPGSGADYNVGPAYDIGVWLHDNLGINHVPVVFPKGGYLGVMGGDPGLSYNEVIAAEGVALEALLDNNVDVQRALADVKAGRIAVLDLWFSAYSQSADGMEDALVRLFGDGGKYVLLRPYIRGTLMFGNPSRQPGPTKVGNNPVGWGIARKIRPQWLKDVTWSITAESPGAPDFYAACDDEIRPVFYEIIVEAETSLSFVEHIVKIAVPVITNLLGSLGGLGGLGTGISTLLGGPLLAGILKSANSQASDPVDQKLIDLLSVKGVLENIPALFHLLGAVGGVMTHGSYYDPHPEFGGRNGLQVACDAVRAYYHR